MFLLKVKDIVEKCCHWGANRDCVFTACAACLNVPADDVCTLASCCIRSQILFITDWAKELLKHALILLLQRTSLIYSENDRILCKCILTIGIHLNNLKRVVEKKTPHLFLYVCTSFRWSCLDSIVKKYI